MPPKPNLRFKPSQSAPPTGASPPLTSFINDDFDENMSLEAMALQMQPESGFSYRGTAERGDLDAMYDHRKGTAELIDDIRLYPKKAPPLPSNTMPSLLASGNARGLHGHVYTPIPLDHKDAVLAAAKGGDARGAAPVAAAKRPAAGSAGTEDADRGVAFLKEGAEEDQRTWQANRLFHEQILKPNTAAPAFLSSSTAGDNKEGDLVWVQMPRFYENAPFDLATMEPGKVGELVVLKSGRMLLRIHNVYYNVSASCEDEPTAERDGKQSALALAGAAPLEGPCSMAVISNSTTSTHFGGGERPSLSCYEVGLLTKKLVCTPTITEGSS